MTLGFDTLLVANRGEIACRITRTAHRLGLRVLAVHSDIDAGAAHVAAADAAFLVGPAAPPDSYLNIDAVLKAAVVGGAQAVHPGYGFLSESPEFARRVAAAGLLWVGPSPEAMQQMADKVQARNLMASVGVPTAAGTASAVASPDQAKAQARQLGFPLMVKAAAGGGGIGMSVVRDESELLKAVATASARGLRSFGSADVFLERYVEGARHVEIQVLGLADGSVVALGERDCSVQRRHQKVAEETPSPGLSNGLRSRMQEMAVLAATTVGYRNAGTIECLVDPASQEFFFLEMNTRLQVEHPVTEMVRGIDLVEEQLRVAAGLPTTRDLRRVEARGHAIELRVYAEDPKRFFPSPGKITTWIEPAGEGVRVDAGYRAGDDVSTHYDPLLAKLCVWAEDRGTALDRAAAAVAQFQVAGVKTNLPLFRDLLTDLEFRSGAYDTGILGRVRRS